MIPQPCASRVDIGLLLETPLFHGLQEKDLESICRKGVCCSVDSGSFFFYQGDPPERIYALLEGRIKLIQNNPEGEQVLIRIIGPYTLFGALVMTSATEYPLSAQASEPSFAIYWSRDVILQVVQQYPILALNTVQMMSEHAHELQERFTQLATERVERRLARTLLRLANQTGRKTPEGVLIDMPLTRKDLAEMIGATLFTVSRLLKKWEQEGLVSSKRESITIRFPHGLVSIAEDFNDQSPE